MLHTWITNTALGDLIAFRRWLPAGLPRSGKLPVINSLRPKISFFAQEGRLVAPIHMKFTTAKGHVGPLGRAKFHANRFTGLQHGPQKLKISTFRLDALALSVIATATWLAGWLAGWVGGWLAVCHSRYCIKTTKRI